MLLKSLRTNIALNLMVLLLLSMLLIDLVILMVMQKVLVDTRIEKGRVMIAALESGLRDRSKSAVQDWRVNSPEALRHLLKASDGMCAVVVSATGQPIYQDGVGCFPEFRIGAMAQQAASERREIIRSSNIFSGIFGGHSGTLMLAAPLAEERGLTLGGGVLMPLDDIFDRLRRSQHIVLIYALVNTALLTFLGVYRLSKLTVKPIQRLVRRAEAFRETDDNVFILEKEDNEFSQLSKSLNRMLIHLAQDKEKLQASVHSLEKANRELEKAQRDLIRAEKLASVGRLSAGIAHEIGNPIGIIKGYLSLLDDATISEEEKADFVARTASEVERIHSIIQQLLDFSRPSGEEHEIVSAHAILIDLEDVCRYQPVLSCVRFRLHLKASSDRVTANARQLRQVFLNLVLNAADAIRDSGGEGVLEIYTENTPGTDGERGDAARLAVRFVDSGSGIPEESLSNIFDPFFTTKAPGKGTGLGLSVSFTIIEGLGGSIKAERNAKGGTTMIIMLPLADRSSV